MPIARPKSRQPILVERGSSMRSQWLMFEDGFAWSTPLISPRPSGVSPRLVPSCHA
jgi:hypothetical protein